MSNWILRAAEHYLTPVYERLHRELLTRDVLHADETTLQVLHEPGKKPQTESYMWLYRTSGDTDKPIVLIQTAIENGLDPYKYLTWLMKTAKDADLSQADMIQNLLPWNAPAECNNRSKE